MSGQIDLDQLQAAATIGLQGAKGATCRSGRRWLISFQKLVRECNLTRRKGADFPTIWKTTLKGHSYIAGSPVQDRDKHGPLLKVPLITGRHLVFDASGFRLD
jgi:hypothetical protein